MPFRNNILAWVCCLVLIVAASVIFAFNFNNFKSIETKTAALQMKDDPVLEGLSASVRTSQPRRVVSTAREDLITAVKRSRELLKQKNELYHKQKTQLIRRINDYDKLQSEYARLSTEHDELKRQFDQLWRDADSSLMMFGEFLEQKVDLPPEVDSNLKTEQNDAGLDSSEQSPNLNTSDNDETRIEQAVLEWQLEYSQGEISELKASFERMSQISNAASMILADIGAPTVPLLIELLNDREPLGVRVWSAWMLGNMGTAATDATEPLNKMRVDPNVELATTAEDALLRIKNNR